MGFNGKSNKDDIESTEDEYDSRLYLHRNYLDLVKEKRFNMRRDGTLDVVCNPYYFDVENAVMLDSTRVVNLVYGFFLIHGINPTDIVTIVGKYYGFGHCRIGVFGKQVIKNIKKNNYKYNKNDAIAKTPSSKSNKSHIAGSADCGLSRMIVFDNKPSMIAATEKTNILSINLIEEAFRYPTKKYKTHMIEFGVIGFNKNRKSDGGLINKEFLKFKQFFQRMNGENESINLQRLMDYGRCHFHWCKLNDIFWDCHYLNGKFEFVDKKSDKKDFHLIRDIGYNHDDSHENSGGNGYGYGYRYNYNSSVTDYTVPNEIYFTNDDMTTNINLN